MGCGRLLWFVAAAGIAAFVGGACGDGGDRLETLKSDPMASYELPGALDATFTEMAGGTAQIASPSEVTRRFTVAAGGVDAAIEEIAAAAVDAGWELRPREVVGFSGDKRIDGLRAQMVISGTDDNNHVWITISSRS